MSDEKEQITINVRSDVAEFIRNRSKDIGGSNQYMGEVVENLVDGRRTNQDAILERLDEIEEKLDENTPSHTSAHTTSSSNSIPEEIQNKLEAEEPIDPDEFDLEQMKGSGKVLDVAELIVKHESGMTKEEIENLFSASFGYSVNSTRQKRKSLMNRLEAYHDYDIDESVISEWIDDEIDRGCLKRSKTKDKMISPHTNVENKKEWYRQEHGGDLNSYLHMDRYGADFETEYIHLDDLEQHRQILRSRLEHILEAEDNGLIADRIKQALAYLK